MVGRPGRIKSKGSEASNSQDGDTPKINRKKQGRPRKSAGRDESPLGSHDGTPFSPANPRGARRRPMPDGSRLASSITEFDSDEDLRSHRVARFLEAHPESREQYAKLMEERGNFPPWIEESEQIEHNGTVYLLGAIVCLFDEDDEEDLPYYAQIRSLIRDSHMRPYASITWLVPRESAPDAHTFDAEHFVHSLIDHKLYNLESLRWVTEQPELPAYQCYDEHRAAIDKERMRELRRRRIDLFKAANFGPEGDADMIRAGDVKLLHTKEHEDDLKEVLDRQRERELERREDAEEAAKGRGSKEIKTDDDTQGEEDERGSERRGQKRRATSRTSTTSKGTNESARSSVKPQDEPMEQG